MGTTPIVLLPTMFRNTNDNEARSPRSHHEPKLVRLLLLWFLYLGLLMKLNISLYMSPKYTSYVDFQSKKKIPHQVSRSFNTRRLISMCVRAFQFHGRQSKFKNWAKTSGLFFLCRKVNVKQMWDSPQSLFSDWIICQKMLTLEHTCTRRVKK
jgi:hypothetical protein